MTADGPAGVRVALRRASTVLSALLLAGPATGCSAFQLAGPAGAEASAPDRSLPITLVDDSADGVGDPAGVAEIVAVEASGPEGEGEGEGEGGEASAGAVVLDAAAMGADLAHQFPAFLARGLPPAALEQVEHYVGLFHAGRARSNFERWLAREGRYRDLILSELAAAGLPEELLYLSMLESGFSPVAVSRAQAVGLWQFIASTGRASGLQIDDWVDERRDPIASTRAAIRHLTELHDALGDWALAAAAYNSGLGRVTRTRGDSGAGYFDMTLAGRLPAETRNYLPLILAAGHVARHREHYGLGHVAQDPPLAYDTVEVEGRTRLSAIARVAGVELAELNALNTHLVRGAAPPVRRYAVRVPAGAASPEIAVRLAALPEDQRLLPHYREVVVVVKPGDSWWGIARANGVTVRELRARNPRIGDVIHPGMRLTVDRRVVTDREAGS